MFRAISAVSRRRDRLDHRRDPREIATVRSGFIATARRAAPLPPTRLPTTRELWPGVTRWTRWDTPSRPEGDRMVAADRFRRDRRPGSRRATHRASAHGPLSLGINAPLPTRRN